MSSAKYYKCPVCGNVVEMLDDKGIPVVCCGKPMKKLDAFEKDGALEKHVPVYEKKGDRLIVRIGEVDHPMTDEHYIVFISVVSDNATYRVDLTPNDKPIAEFPLVENGIIYAYCNLHNLWKTEIK